ncbi:MAG: carbohydrate ABC transporter permease [Gleimia sp.]|jgi:multiple sugar transport system permease protein
MKTNDAIHQESALETAEAIGDEIVPPVNELRKRILSKPRRKKITPGRLLLHLFLIVGSIAMFGPFVWMVLSSFKTLPQLLSDPLSFLPDPYTTSNFVEAWNALPFGRAYFNSIYITVLVVAGGILTTAMAGYAFARIPFRGSKYIFAIVLITQMIPRQVTLVPFYQLMSWLGWVDSHLAIIIPGMLMNPFGIFLCRQFIRSIPHEVTEAAMLDGCSQIRTFFQIILPLIRPGLGALGIIIAIDAWNNFLMPLILLNSTELFTVPLLLSQFQGQFGGVNYGLIMAATSLSTIPMLIAFVIGQKQIISSLASSGLGGR